MNIELTEPFLFAGKAAKSITVAQLPFVKLAEVATRAGALSNAEYPFLAALRTLRMIEQCTVTLADGTTGKLDTITVRQLPIPVAMLIHKNLESRDIPTGKLVGDGDGISTPITYELGTPIVTGSGEDKNITELEFLAKTYGDLEIVMGETNDLERTTSLIKYVSKPIGMVTLPSWAIDQITIPDGMFVMNEIVKRFLPSSDGSETA